MKKLFIFLSIPILTIFSPSIFSQNYQCFSPGKEYIFLSDATGYATIKIDSLETLAQDSVYYFYPVIRLSQNQSTCYRVDAPSWMGSKMVKKPNGEHVFFNLENDTVRILANSPVGTSWTCYQNDSLTIEAYVENISIMEFIGITDSCKSLSLQAYNDQNNPVPHPINDYEIIISKQYGIIKSPGLGQFPGLASGNEYSFFYYPQTEFTLSGVSNPQLGVQNLKWFEIYDFQPGDEIHIRETSSIVYPMMTYWDTTLTITKYVDRADYDDSIVYTISKIQKHVHVTDTSSTTNVTTVYGSSIVHQNEAFDQPPLTPISNDGNSAYVYTMHDNPTHAGVLKTKISGADFLYFANDTCWYQVLSDGCFPAKQYYSGLGGPYFECYGWMSQTWKRKLVYYKKGDNEWGNPLYIDTTLNIDNAPANNSKLKIYPNPVSEKLTVENVNDIPGLVFRLYNAQGAKLRTQKLQDTFTRIDISNLAPGLYFYTIRNQNMMEEKNKIVIY